MKKETKNLIKSTKIIIEDIFDNYDNGKYSQTDYAEIKKWIEITKELNDRLDRHDEKISKNSLSFTDAIKKWFGANK